uniref:PQQ-binding-like beta-propeller repeat protein n=1 Tax=Roseihalotalea indica TaxID=2867963 RepID=A0AA49JIY5_9BACT|nr:PQQ-binding-like beta-propeller repeat protein [Tunicatimonas sp. TK19036]
MGVKKRVALLLTVVVIGVATFYFIVSRPDRWELALNGILVFSSPRAVDLNQDQVQDIILGAGAGEWMDTPLGVIAVDGKDGEVLWYVETRNQMAGSPIFQDITDDGIPDVFIGGRSAQLYAINGANGEVLWEYLPFDSQTVYEEDSSILNFFTPQWLPDQNSDGLDDLLISYGGFVKAGPTETKRPVGRLMVFSGKDGEVLASAPMPDGKETYFSPLVHDFEGNGALTVIFGSGGETIDGHLYRCPLANLMQNDLSSAVPIASGEGKGFIAPPVLVDITSDGINDIVVNSVNARMLAFDGKDNTLLWQVPVGEGMETYSTPAPVYTHQDSIPDFFGSYGMGTWPHIHQSVQLLVDGETGTVTFYDTLGTFQYTSPVVGDVTGDDQEDVLFSINQAIARKSPPSSGLPDTLYVNQLMLYDLTKAKPLPFEAFVFEGNNLASTPLLTDLDGDGYLDLIYCHMTDQYNFFAATGMVLQRYETRIKINKPIRWGGYMGTHY